VVHNIAVTITLKMAIAVFAKTFVNNTTFDGALTRKPERHIELQPRKAEDSISLVAFFLRGLPTDHCLVHARILQGIA
jgi:hypothetical protein